MNVPHPLVTHWRELEKKRKKKKKSCLRELRIY